LTHPGADREKERKIKTGFLDCMNKNSKKERKKTSTKA
jgi:hypothetical protein